MKLFWQRDSTPSYSLRLGGYRSSVSLRSSLCGPEHGVGVIYEPEYRHLTPLPVSQGVQDVRARQQIDLCTGHDPSRVNQNGPRVLQWCQTLVSKQITSRPAASFMVSHSSQWDL